MTDRIDTDPTIDLLRTLPSGSLSKAEVNWLCDEADRLAGALGVERTANRIALERIAAEPCAYASEMDDHTCATGNWEEPCYSCIARDALDAVPVSPSVDPEEEP